MHQQDPNPRPATGYPYPYPYPNPPSTTGYPYQNHNPNPYYPPPQPNPRAILLRRLFIIFMTILIILALLLIIFFLIVRPQYPLVSITTLTLSNFNITNNNQLSGKWDLSLLFQNPNSKVSLHYDTVLCSVFFRREILSDTRLQPFDQGKKEERAFNATLSVSGTYVDEKVVEGVVKQRSGSGDVVFGLRMASFVTFKYGAFRKRRYLSVYCDDVAVSVPGNSTGGKMVGLSKRCRSY